MEVNVKLVKKVAKYIREHPEHYDQRVFLRGSTVGPLNLRVSILNKCGTVACVAGTAIAFCDKRRLKKVEGWDWDEAGEIALGIDERLAFWLFSTRRNEDAMPFVLDALAEGVTDINKLKQIEMEHSNGNG